jgi:hypothetical protein
LPEASIRTASFGTGVLRTGPKDLIIPFLITTVCAMRIPGSLIGITFTPIRANVLGGICDGLSSSERVAVELKSIAVATSTVKRMIGRMVKGRAQQIV